MKRSFILILINFFILIVYTQVYADVVLLKNGRQIEGEIIEETDNAVRLKIKIGEVTLQQDQILSIEKKELSPDFFEVELPPKPKPTKVELKAEGYQTVTALKFNLNIEAEFRRSFDGDTVLISGTTNLPPKSVLYLSLKTPSQTVAVRKLFVENSTFSDRIGPFGNKRIPPGRYIVEATFSPERQESEGAKRILAETEEIRTATDLSIGSVHEIEERTNKRKSELAPQFSELKRLYDELNIEYEAQKKNFNEGGWNTWSLKWQSQLGAIKSSNEDYRNKMLALDFPEQENALNEVIYDLNLLWNRYAAELFKRNNLTFDVPPSNDTRNSDSLKKAIQDRLKTSSEFSMASNKK
ncbi:MAG: hypothetical protein Q8R05_04510 [Candidatus Omnitrophota bacterium]|nr:hypothetical protein [Candidatus Omnitrophota bacterium]